MSRSRRYLALDIGEVRIGVATASDDVKIAVPYDTIAMREDRFRADILELVTHHEITTLVVGYPRNQSGEATAQTRYVEKMVAQLDDIDATIVYQDESLTSVLAESRLKSLGGSYTKEDIDAQAAVIILQDYLEFSL